MNSLNSKEKQKNQTKISNQTPVKNLCDPSLSIDNFIYGVSQIIDGSVLFEDCKKHNQNLNMTFRESGIIGQNKKLKENVQAQENNPDIKFKKYQQNENEQFQQNLSITFKRDGIIDKNFTVKEVTKNILIKKIPIDLNLQFQHLDQQELRAIIKILRNYSICLQKYISSGGEADVYLGYIIDGNGKEVQAVFRIVKTNQIQKMREEYLKVIGIKNPRNLIEYEGLIQINDNILVFIMKKYSFSLKDKLKKQISDQQFWNILMDLIHGLMELRINNIIHSDIKPANILMDQEERCFYSDFGMALKLKNKENFTNDKPGFTPAFCSPEHLNSQSLSYASDIYSLGKIFMQLSEDMSDKQTKIKVDLLINNIMLQEDSQKRIQAEDLLQSFIDIIPNEHLDTPFGYFYEVRINKGFFKENIDTQINIQFNNKIKVAYKKVELQVFHKYYQFNKLQLNKSTEDFEMLLLYELVFLCSNNPQLQLCYLKQIMDIAQKRPDSDEKNKILITGYQYLGKASMNCQNYKDASHNFENMLKILLQKRESFHELISQAYHSLGTCNFLQQNLVDGISFMKKSISERKAYTDQSNIETLFELGQFYEFQKDFANSQLMWKQISENWQTYQLGYDKLTIEKRDILMSCVTQSLFKIEKYFEAYQLELKRLRVQDQLQKEVKTEIKIIDLIGKLTIEQRQNALSDLLQDDRNDLAKKIILLEFAEYHLLVIHNSEQIPKILEACNRIKDELTLNQQIQEKVIFSRYYQNIKNFRESSKNIKQGIHLLRQSDQKGQKEKPYQLHFIGLITELLKQSKEGDGNYEDSYVSKDFNSKLINLNSIQKEFLQSKSIELLTLLSISISECFDTLKC